MEMAKVRAKAKEMRMVMVVVVVMVLEVSVTYLKDLINMNMVKIYLLLKKKKYVKNGKVNLLMQQLQLKLEVAYLEVLLGLSMNYLILN